MLKVGKQHKKIIRNLLTYAKKTLLASQVALLKPFIEQYYLYISLEDLESRSTKDLLGALLSHWELMYNRKSGEYKRRIFNPHLETDGWETSHTVLQFILEDQPFLVDTLCTEINRKGLTVHFIVHLGGIKIIRNSQGDITQVLSFDSENKEALSEAPIYIEVDRQTDPEVLEELGRDLDAVLNDARVAVADWRKMLGEVYEALKEMEEAPPPVSKEEIDESKAFLHWMVTNHFTFLGVRKYDFVGSGDKQALQLVPGSGLGILRESSQSKIRRYYADLPEEARKLTLSKQILLLAKTNTRSTVHGHRYTDFVSVKRFNKEGDVLGERWFIGLYTSNVYIESPNTVPIIRLKVAEVLKNSGLLRNGHAYKALAHILENMPRDDLVQATIHELFNLSIGILQLQDRRCIRLFMRKDIFSRFISCQVFVPRDEFNMELCDRMQKTLLASFHGLEISYETIFPDSILARIHFTIRLDVKKPRTYNVKAIEQKLIAAGLSWRDGLHDNLVKYFGEEKGNVLILSYAPAFSAAYKEAFSPETAVSDIEHIEKLSDDNRLEMNLYRPLNMPAEVIRFKLFRRHETAPLSDAIPILEKMGLRVIGEQPYRLLFKDGNSVWINDFNMRCSNAGPLDLDTDKEIFQEAFKKIWEGNTEHDGFNSLILSANLSWQKITILRAYAKYLRQIGFTFSQDYMEQTLSGNPNVARLLVKLFYYRFDPAIQNPSKTSSAELEEGIKQALDTVANLDEDRILRMFVNLIEATVRTNYFQVSAEGEPKAYLSFKFNPSVIQNLPLPYPEHEIFIYSPRFEGTHLRAGKVARGGIRWSDRREDFRREVLGLMKAQQVKNAVIVAAGAKGGFIPKCLLATFNREEILQEGIRCYKNFMRGLLDLTDNLRGNAIVPPENTVCYDGDDPYLVVAADKGTATFSDIANSISEEYGYWLGDAFASGGSTGYDHKKIAITARGAWESVKRHFQELAIDIENHPFTVVGIGDMAGDVFGNGMLQSRQIKLVGAFNGTHIFVDPNPDPEVSFEERQRLFNLPRSTWEDYNPELISSGGGVYKRSVKSIKISAALKNIFGIKKDNLTPNELIQALLKSPVDLMWNGGIGTFVKASNETHLDAGDRTNDAIRIDGHELTCRVVVEGGNLGFTQLGRIEYEFSGGRINTDFIDNSGGVDCSDHEVNIKILLNDAVSRGQLTQKARNSLLAKMTDEVVQLVLHNNYRQVRAIGIAVSQSIEHIDMYARYLKDYSKQGKIDIKLEFLPDEDTMLIRKASGKGLTRPEIAVLLAYSKNILKADIIASDLTADVYLHRYMQYAFPKLLGKRYPQSMEHHRLRREIIATQLSNLLITDMGITFVYQMQDETKASPAEIVRAYVIAREIFDLPSFWETIESLQVPVPLQVEMTLKVTQLIRRSVRWFLRNPQFNLDVKRSIDIFSSRIKVLNQALPELLVGIEKTYYENKITEWVNSGVSDDIATRVAGVDALYSSLNIIEIAIRNGHDLKWVAGIYFALAARLGLDEFSRLINSYPLESRWMILARSAVKGDLDWQQRALTMAVLKLKIKTHDINERIDIWFEKNKAYIERWQSVFAEIKASVALEYAMLVVALRELLGLAQASLEKK